MRKFLSILIAIIMVLGVIPLGTITVLADEVADTPSAQADTSVTVTSGSYSLSVNKTNFEVGESILVTATGVADNDWIGIYKTNQEGAFLWDNISTHGNGVAFDIREATQTGSGYDESLASVPEGKYVIRLMPNGGTDISKSPCYVVITVGNPPAIEGDTSLLTVDKTTYELGEAVMVSGKISTGSKDWIGVYPINNPNGTYSNMWKYVSSIGEGVEYDIRGGATLPVGDYLVCYVENDGARPTNAVAWSLITVTEPATEPDTGEGTEGEGTEGEGTETGGTETGGTETGGTETGGAEGEGTETGGTESEGETLENGMIKYTAPDGQILILKKTYAKNEPIYAYATGVNQKDWIGIAIKGDTSGAIRWQYIDSSAGGMGQGEKIDIRELANVAGAYKNTETASIPEGEYTVHLVENDKNIRDGYSVISVDIVVTGDTIEDDNTGDGDTGGDTGGDNTGGEDGGDTEPSVLLSTEKTTFAYGEPIYVKAWQSVSEKDWVAIFKPDGSYFSWYYISSVGDGVAYDARQGATVPAGEYSIRLIPDDQSKEAEPLARIDIVVTEEEFEGEVDGEGPISAVYTPIIDKDGYLNGTISVNVSASDVGKRLVAMFWGDENGAFEEYTPIIYKPSAQSTTFTFTSSLFIPEGATHLWIKMKDISAEVYSKEQIGVEIGRASVEITENLTTSFYIVSDLHIGKDGYPSSENFEKMLNEAIALNPNGAPIFIVGDMADHGKESEFAEMVSIHAEVMASAGKNASDYPLFLTLGNHDYPAMGGTFLQYATLPDGTHPTDTSYDFWLNGYHYIFLATDTSSSSLTATLNEETLAWLDSKLNENRDTSRPTFVFLHQPMYNTVSGSLPGENWDGVANEEELIAVLKSYPEVLLFNGHTHWTMDSVSNIFEGTEELPIHAFNCASVSYLWTGINTITGENLDGSQGYQIDIYGKKVFVRGRDFANSKWVGSAQYLIDYESCEHEFEITEMAYENGFASEGTATYTCTLCGATKSGTYEPMIEPVGYSVKEDTTRGNGITGGYKVNYTARKLYEMANGVTIEIGVAIFNPDKLTSSDIFTNGTLNATEGAIQIDIAKELYSSVAISINNIAEDKLDLDLVICAYINIITTVDEQKTYETKFVQHETTKIVSTIGQEGNTVHSVSVNSLK